MNSLLQWLADGYRDRLPLKLENYLNEYENEYERIPIFGKQRESRGTVYTLSVVCLPAVVGGRKSSDTSGVQ
jgi:hypothetical protein